MLFGADKCRNSEWKNAELKGNKQVVEFIIFLLKRCEKICGFWLCLVIKKLSGNSVMLRGGGEGDGRGKTTDSKI